MSDTKPVVLKRLPFDGEWLVFWGGDTKEQNHHHGNTAQNFAFDFVEGAVGDRNDSFGQDIFATDDGIVVEAVEGIRDNDPMHTNDYMLLGNHVVIQHGNLFSITAHLQQGSLLVRKGDKVISGQKIGACGNSGNSSESHLHFHLQDSFNYTRINDDYKSKQPVAKGCEVAFKEIIVNGEAKTKQLPVKGDKVRNL